MTTEMLFVGLALCNLALAGLLARYSRHRTGASNWWRPATAALLLLAVVDLAAALQQPAWWHAIATAAADIVLIATIATLIRNMRRLDAVHTRDTAELAWKRDEAKRALRDRCGERF